MPILYVNTGSAANKGDGDSLRVAFSKINQNFNSSDINMVNNKYDELMSIDLGNDNLNNLN